MLVPPSRTHQGQRQGNIEFFAAVPSTIWLTACAVRAASGTFPGVGLPDGGFAACVCLALVLNADFWLLNTEKAERGFGDVVHDDKVDSDGDEARRYSASN